VLLSTAIPCPVGCPPKPASGDRAPGARPAFAAGWAG